MHPKPGRTAALLDQIRHRLVEGGESLDRVEEELINAPNDLSEDERAGLWLYAWSFQTAAHQRYQARSFLTELASREP